MDHAFCVVGVGGGAGCLYSLTPYLDMTFGYESEHFLKREGSMVLVVPSRFPRDASQALVEVRSGYYSDPRDTEESYKERKWELLDLARREGFEVVTVSTYLEYTAGFHVHFGTDRLFDIPLLLEEFSKEFDCGDRNSKDYRMKPYGFELRGLPATVEVGRVTKFLVRGMNMKLRYPQ